MAEISTTAHDFGFGWRKQVVGTNCARGFQQHAVFMLGERDKIPRL
jgi:hypothetical protein